MKTLILTLLALFALILSPASSFAAINPGGAVNAASFAAFGLPNSGIAPGSLFLVFGTDLGAPGLTQTGFPLPNVLAGTSVQVTVGGQTLDCPIVFTTPGQIAALLPSNTPAGSGQIRVTFNGVASTAQIVVSETAVGIFTQGQSGAGPAIVQNFENSASTPLNTLLDAARPGQVLIIWATGLGGVGGAEAAGPLPGVKPAGVSVRVLIDGQEAQVIDFGRSGCCSGLDQLVAVVPPNTRGCYVPLIVLTEKNGVTVASNSGSIAVADGGGPCEDEGGVAPAELASGQGTIRLGILTLGRGRGSISVPGLGSGTSISDLASGLFVEMPRNQFLGGAFPVQLPRRRSCTVFTALGQDAGPAAPSAVNFLDAGDLMRLDSPGGSRNLPKFDDPLIYQTNAVETIELNGQPQPSTGALFLAPGTHTFSAPGGSDVGAFSVSETVPDLFDWTNSNQKTISRSQPHTVFWTGGDPRDIVLIQGSSTAETAVGTRVTASFVCFAEVSASSFTIPAYILQSLPPSASLFGVPFGTLSVGSQSLGKRFTAPGLDFGILSYTVLNAEPGIAYE